MPKHRLQIADCSADLTTGELRRGSRKTRMSPKATEILTVLCQRAGTVVSKQELLDQVWPDTYVNDDSLWHAIAELRQFFDDDARQPRVIETLPRRGYRLIATVQQQTETAPPTVSEPGLRTSPQRRPSRHLVYSVLFTGTLWFAWVALAHFYDDSPALNASLLEQGLAAFEHYTAGHNERAIELLEAAVDQRPDNARARAALADAYAFKALHFSVEPWWQTQALKEATRATELAPELPEGYKAMGLAWVANGNRQAAQAAYRRAVELRPGFHQALNNLALLEGSLGNLAQAAEYFARTVDLVPGDAVYLSNYATSLRLLGWNQRAEAVLETASALPGDEMTPSIAWQRALIDLERGANEAARLRLEAALDIAPRDSELLIHAAEFDLHLGRPETALAFLTRATAARGGPHEIRHLLLLSAAGVSHQGHGQANGQTDLAFAQALLDGVEPATALQHPRQAMDRAMAHLALDNPAQALDWLGHTISAGYRDRACLQIDPVFKPLHDEPRFEHLLQRLDALIEAER